MTKLRDQPAPTASNYVAPPSSWQSAIDVKLRDKGYSIHARPDHDQPSWSKGGIVYKQSEVLRRLQLGQEDES